MNTNDINILQFKCDACGKVTDTCMKGVRVEQYGVVKIEICSDCVIKKIYELFNIKPEEK